MQSHIRHEFVHATLRDFKAERAIDPHCSWHTARIEILGPIVQTGVTASGIAKQLERVYAKNLEILIESPGGNLNEAIRIYDVLAQRRERLIVIVDKYAHSGASMIAMAGDEVVVSDGARMALHWPSSGPQTEDYQDPVVDRLVVPIYANKTRQLPRTIRALLASATDLSARRCIELGFADRIDPRMTA